MPSAPSRFDVEQLHRLMMQASVDASQLEKRLQEEQKTDGLSTELRHWHDAADHIFGAVERVKTELLRDGTAKDHVERIADRLKELKERSRKFDVQADFEHCVSHWKALAVEFTQVSGKHRDPLVKLLESRRAHVDRVTEVLSQARKSEGLLPEKYRKVRELRERRDEARKRYEELRQKYLEAERNHQAAERQKQLQAASKEHEAKKAPLPNLAGLQEKAKKGPVLVRLPDPKAAGSKTALAKPLPPPPPRPQVVKPVTPAIKGGEKKPEPKKAAPGSALRQAEEKKKLEEKKKAEDKKKADEKKKLDAKKPKPGEKKPQPRLPLPSNRPPALIKPGFHHVARAAAAKGGPARISLERVERVAGYPTGMDGIGRGGQSAGILFRAENLPEALSIQGTTSLQLGCAVRLDVLPSVQLFSAIAGAPLKGRLSLMLVSSGGRLGTISPRSALDAAKTAARAGGKQVAAKLGLVGKQLESAICDVVEDAAAKIFSRAQANAPQNRLPIRPAGHGKGPAVEHHVARFNHALGSILVEARAVKGGQDHRHKLLNHLDRDHHARDSVAGRLEQTLSHLATATHRTLTDPVAGELRSNLARMDAILSRIKGKRDALEQGASEIGDILARMGSLANGKGGAPHVAEFKKLIEERKGQLRKIAGETRQAKQKAIAVEHRMAKPSAAAEIAMLRKLNPGLDKLLKNASQSQLAAELAKVQKSALSRLSHGKPPRGGLGSSSLTGAFQALGGGQLGGFGGGHRGGLGSLSGMGGALSKALEKQLENEIRRAKPGDIGKILAGMHKAPKGTALHDLAKKAEEKQKRLATHKSHRGPMPSAITAEALLEVFKDHPKGRGFARNFARGGALHALCETAQRGHGLPIGQAAQHYLASRGSSQVFNAVSTFNSLIKAGHKPHRWGLGSIGHFVSSHVSSAVHAVSNTVSKVTSSIGDVAKSTFDTARLGISSFANNALSIGKSAFGSITNVVKRGVGGIRSVAKKVGSSVISAARTVGGTVHQLYDSAKSAAHKAYDWGSNALHKAGGFISSSAHALWKQAKKAGSSAWDFTKKVGSSAWGGIKQSASTISNVARSGYHMLQSGASWVAHKAGDAFDWAKHKAGGAVDWAKRQAHAFGHRVESGIEWVKKTGVVGAIGSGLKKGLSFVKKAAEFTPIGLAVKAGKWAAGGGLAKVWKQTKSIAGKAWGGIKTAYNATSKFLQSPAGQFLVTGLSLAASFIPGGMLVKGLVGAGIGAITAISEGKDWKGILAGAAGGALTGALPFLKIGPLAKIGVGALQGGISALASGGNLKDCLKGAAGGAVDAFDPGALKALGKLKGVSSATKLLSGGKLSKAEKEFMAASKFAGPLRGLEKAMANPKARRIVGGLEKAGSKTVRGGIWVSGKAAKVQGVLDKVVGAGDKVHGVLTQVHDLAPGLADLVGDNAVGHFINNVGDLAGKGDEKLSKALEYGHTASDQLSKYRGYLDKGLGYAGVKDPAKAYEKMMARKDLARGKKGGLEHVAKLKLEDHRKKHPELHLAEATGKRTRGQRPEVKVPRKRPEPGTEKYVDSKGRVHGMGLKPAKGKKASPHDKPEEHALPKKVRGGNKPKSKLEQALAKGRGLIKKGEKVAQGVHDGLGKVQGVVEKGLAGAQKVQSGLEEASKLAKLGAGLVGEDTDLGKHLLEMADKAEHVHGYLEQGIGYAEEFNKGVGKAHELTGKIPGVHDQEEDGKKPHGKKTKGHKPGEDSPLAQATQLSGGKKGKHKAAEGGHDGTPTKKSVHGEAKPSTPHPQAKANETEKERSARLQHAWDLINTISRCVKRYESDYAKAQREIGEHLGKGEGQKASLKLIDLGTECDDINRYIAEARTAAKGNDRYLRDIKFYEEWHATTKKKLHAAIADTKGLGSGTPMSVSGISEQTHPDIFANAKAIYAVETKVMAFGAALHDHDAAEHVKKVLAEAKAAKADLQRLKTKYKKDKAAWRFLTGGGEQDRLIDESIKKLEAAGKGEAPGKKPAAITKKDPTKGKSTKPGRDVMKTVEGGLNAIQKYRKKALKAGKKVDSTLGKLEHALGQGIRIGKKVDGGLEKVSGIAEQLSGLLGGDDTPMGHLAHQVGDVTGQSHEKLHDALGLAAKGKKGLHKGHELFHMGLELAKGHHEKKIEKVHGKKPANAEHEHGGASHAELLKHGGAHAHKKSPHGDFDELLKDGKTVVDSAGNLYRDGKKIVHDGKKFVHDAKHAGHDAEHMFHDGQKMWKTGKKSVHDVQHGVKDLKHGFGDAKSLWGHLQAHDWKGALGDGKHLLKDGKGLIKDGKQIFGDGKKLFGEGKHLFEEGKHLWGEGKHLWGEAKNLFGEGKHALKDAKHLVEGGKHVIQDVGHLIEKGKDWVHANLHKLDLSNVIGQAKSALHKLPDWLKSIFGGGKPSPHDPAGPGMRPHRHRHHPHGPQPGPQPGPAPHHDGGFSEADIAQVVHGAMGWVTSFGKAVTAAIKDIEGLMKAGDTKKAGDRVQAVSVTSEQTRFEVTRAVSTSAKYPALAKQAKAASTHYLAIRKHFFDFVKGLHGLGGQTQELEGVDGKKYPDLLELSTDIDSLKVKVDALGDLKHADTPMQGPVGDLKKEAGKLRSRVAKAQAKHKADPAAAQVIESLSQKLSTIEKQLGAHSAKGNVGKGDKDLGLPGPAPRPHKPPRRRKHPKKHDPIDDVLNGDDNRISVDRGGARGDMDISDSQDIDPAAADTWIGSGEGVKLFSEVFGAFLPAEGAVVHHHAGGGGKPRPHAGGGIGFDVHGGAHGSVDIGGMVHAQGGIGGALHGHLGAGGLDLSGKGHLGGAIDVGGFHMGGGVSAHGGLHIGADGIQLGGGLDLGVNIGGHRFGAHLGGKIGFSTRSLMSKLGKLKGKATGFFKGLFDHLEGFAGTIGKWAKMGAGLLGKGMHFAEMGMHGLSFIEKAAAKVQGMAGKAEGFLGKMGLGKLAGFAGKIGGAAGWVGKESKLLHGGLKTADKWMGKGKKVAGEVGGVAGKAAGIFDKAEHGRFGSLLNLFKASKGGDGMDGRLVPEKMRLGSQFDEPRRLDVMTMSRMEMFLGGSFSGVRIHTGPGAAQVTQRYNAEAVTVKDHIFFAPGRFNPSTVEGQRLLAHELTHVLQKGRPNLDVRTAESEALRSEHTFGYGAPAMETLNLSQPAPDFKLADGEGLGSASGVHTAKRNRSRGHEAGGKDTLPDGEEFIEQISNRVYEMLMEELEHSFESR